MTVILLLGLIITNFNRYICTYVCMYVVATMKMVSDHTLLNLDGLAVWYFIYHKTCNV